MSNAKHETTRREADSDVEIRIREFRSHVIAALRNIITIAVLVETLLFWIEYSPSPSWMPRWACIAVLSLVTGIKEASSLQPAFVMLRNINSAGRDSERSRNHDLATRITLFEDWTFAHFCVVASLLTVNAVATYCVIVIGLSFRSLFDWICTMCALCLVYWLFRGTLRLYRKVKGTKSEEATGVLIGVNILRVYSKFDGVETRFVLGSLARAPFEVLKFWLDIIGFQIGRGPLFGKSVVQ
jgi:hypothetical protein